MAKPRIVYRRPIQKRSTPGGSIVPWIVIAAFLALCMIAWQRHMDDIMVDTNPAMQLQLSHLLDALDNAKPKFHNHRAEVLADLWGVTQKDLDAPVDIFHRH